MDFIQSIVLGIVQGVTEFLPISSSAHLHFIPDLFGWATQSMLFDLSLHFGTLIAILIFFKEEIKQILFSLTSISRLKSDKTLLLIIIGTLPLIPIYLILKPFDSAIQSFNITTIIMLVIFGIPMIFIESILKRANSKVEKPTYKQILLIGTAQGIALINGVSRSGITIMTGMISGLSKNTAKYYSFLISIPAITLGFISALSDYISAPASTSNLDTPILLIVGTLIAFISGYISIKFFMKYLSEHSLAIFGYYRIALALFLYLRFFA